MGSQGLHNFSQGWLDPHNNQRTLFDKEQKQAGSYHSKLSIYKKMSHATHAKAEGRTKLDIEMKTFVSLKRLD